MKLLKIENNEGYYLTCEEDYRKVDQITKEDILRLMSLLYENEESEFDKPEDSGSKKINMPSQFIVYERLYGKFLDIYEKKGDIIEQVNLEFEKAFEAYKE